MYGGSGASFLARGRIDNISPEGQSIVTSKKCSKNSSLCGIILLAAAKSAKWIQECLEQFGGLELLGHPFVSEKSRENHLPFELTAKVRYNKSLISPVRWKRDQTCDNRRKYSIVQAIWTKSSHPGN